MSLRRAKQLIYGTLYVLILLLLIGAVYIMFIRPFREAPTITICTPSTCAPTSTVVFATSSVSIFVTSPGHDTFLTNVLDTDSNYGARVLNYEIDLYDASGALIESLPEQSFIYPTQTKYLVVPNVAVQQSVDHATLAITSAEWTASSTLGAIPQFVLQNVQGALSSTTISVSGQLTNANLGSYEKIIVIALFTNANTNAPSGVSQTEIDNLPAQSTTNFSIIYPVEPNVDPATNQVIVYGIR